MSVKFAWPSKEISVRGVNFGGWFSQVDAIQEKDPQTFPGLMEHIETFLGADDFRRVASWGFDHIRLPVDWQVAFHEANLKPNEQVLSLLDRAIDQALESGLELILDLHRCPGNDFEQGAFHEQTFFTDPEQRKDCLKIWAILAERYGHRPGVMLELLNEPVAPSAAIWNIVKDELATEIRRHAPKATLVVGSNFWNHASEFAFLTPVEDDNVLYSVHVYNPVVFTHQKAPWIPGEVFKIARAYPSVYEIPDVDSKVPVERGLWDKSRMGQMLEPVFRFREKHGVRVACNEFGVYMGGADTQSRLNWMNDLMDLFQENQIGWSYWNYKNLDFGIISQGERLFQDSPQYDNPDRIDSEMLELLKRH